MIPRDDNIVCLGKVNRREERCKPLVASFLIGMVDQDLLRRRIEHKKHRPFGASHDCASTLSQPSRDILLT